MKKVEYSNNEELREKYRLEAIEIIERYLESLKLKIKKGNIDSNINKKINKDLKILDSIKINDTIP